MRKTILGLLLAGLLLAGCGSSSSSNKSSAGSGSATAGSATSAAGSSSATTQAAANTSAASCPDNPVTFAVEPYDAGPALQKAYQTLAGALQTNLGCKVALTINSSYVAEIEAMRADKVDIGEFGPLGYVFAKKIAHAEPVAAFGTPDHKPTTYTAGIWVPKASSIKTVSELKGKTLALAETTSTSGALYPVYALVQAGFKCHQVASCEGVTIKYAGGHPESMLALTHGTVDAAEVNSQQEATAKAAGQFNPADYREIWKSSPIENDPITVRGDLPAAFKARVKQALLKLTPAQVKAVDTELGTGAVGPMIAATDSMYSSIATLAAKEGLGTSALG